MNKIEKALEIAIKAHEGQIDNDGEASILHSLAVGLMGETDEERMAGFLHDAIQSSKINIDDILAQDIPESVVNALNLLNFDNVSFEDYIQRIVASNNPIALKVKYNDLMQSSKYDKNNENWHKKHNDALEIIRKKIEDMNKVRPYQPSDNCEYAVFAAGCFWGVQHYFQKQKGVLRTLAGYTGGKEEFPSYEDVRSHNTSHVEAVLVEYKKEEVSYEDLCKLFFEIHDPSQTDGQGPDKGMQYLSGVFYHNQEQLQITDRLIALLRDKGYEVNTIIKPLHKFWIAEDYHQNYYENTGGSPYCHFRIKKF